MFQLLIANEESFGEDLKNQIICRNRNITGIETVQSGFVALERIRRIRPDIMIVDTDLPDIGGLMVARKAVQLVPGIKIIFISKSKDFKFAKEALRLKACAYLLKPVDNFELSAALERASGERHQEIVFEEEKARLGRFFMQSTTNMLSLQQC